ncbi:maleylpyruvate isomerase family mycothiol-dependent enzyme [soil metagenome]
MLSGIAADEVRRLVPDADIENEIWPTAGQMADHLGSIYRWVASVLRSGIQEKRGGLPKPSDDERSEWFDASRTELLEALNDVDSGRECWTLLGAGTAAFWTRRMTHETIMHIGDLRSAGRIPAHVVNEVSPEDYADGIDEHFEVFLSRSAASLPPLPGSLALVASDSTRSWLLSPTWEASTGNRADAVVHATTGDLALFAWDRVRPVELVDSFVVDGDPAILEAYRDSPVHP